MLLERKRPQNHPKSIDIGCYFAVEFSIVLRNLMIISYFAKWLENRVFPAKVFLFQNNATFLRAFVK